MTPTPKRDLGRIVDGCKAFHAETAVLAVT